MVSRLLVKNTWTKIRRSFGRYVSLFFIVLLGAGFYAGIHATVPDISAVADRYFRDYKLTDFKIVSTMGLTDEDVNALKALDLAVYPSYSVDTLASGKAIRVHALEESVNTVKLTDGRLPQNQNECVADRRFYSVGDTVRVSEDAALKNKVFTVVGAVESVLYLAEDYGNTTVGDGTLYSFIFVGKENFTLDAYTEIYILSSEAEKAAAYSGQYDDISRRVNNKLVEIKPGRENARYEEIYRKANSNIQENEEKLNQAKQEGEKEFADAKAKLDSNAQKLKDGKSELAANEAKLNDSISKQNKEFNAAKEQLSAAWTEINALLWKAMDTKKKIWSQRLKNTHGYDCRSEKAVEFPHPRKRRICTA
jgi:putative ABC transport system permease protein